MSPSLASLHPRREISLAALAETLGGRLVGPDGAGDRVVSGLTTLEQADPEHVSFLSSEKFLEAARGTRAAGVIAKPGTRPAQKTAVLEVPDVWGGVARALAFFCPTESPRSEIHASAVVSPEARLGEGVSVGPLTVIEARANIGDRVRVGAQCFVGCGAVLGDDTMLHPQVAVLAGVELGRRVICHSGVVLGGDGYKYEVVEGRLTKIPQVGTVVIEDDVEIGANSTIDRASFTETRVGARTKIDNLVHLAHNVVVGPDCMIIAQVGVAGSTKIGRGCVLAGQAGVADNIEIADGVRLGAQSGVAGSITEPGDYFGSPPLPVKEQARVLISMRRVPDLIKKVRDLQKSLDELTKK